MTTPNDSTITSIRLNPVSQILCGLTAYGCGCRTTGTTWELCLYHEGFDIGVETTRHELGSKAIVKIGLDRCSSAIIVKGEKFLCDWPVDDKGAHDGWAHCSKAAEAIWEY
jgi:hypothetical protein